MQEINASDSKALRIKQVAWSCFKLGVIGFGGIAGMVATIENEMVVRRKWIDHQHFTDILSTSYIIPGPNAVEIIMHCGKERGGRLGLVVAGICYIFPAMLICLVFGYFYQRYSAIPDVQDFIFGIRPATTALVIGAVIRLSKGTIKTNWRLITLCLLVFAGALYGINEVYLLLAAGFINLLLSIRKPAMSLLLGLVATPAGMAATTYSNSKLFLIFLKIGAILYGSGYVLFGYMDESLVRHQHWITRQQLIDAIAVGQITPGPILSSATFAGYLINGVTGGVLATVAIFLPSFFISFFLHKVITWARGSQRLRYFLDGLSAASIAVIAVVGIHLLGENLSSYKSAIILLICLVLSFFSKKITSLAIILIGSIGGYLMLIICHVLGR
ncbi:chromate efflux transporter [Chitinophaga sp. Cy-1792]|uniref:chromate efflux transporter n=1 Tax=Chitinophaga sp. Cy-1792 TaxID=2608339 RepID=UPI0014212EF1|nr:chromate efflux transporter [Chitinophaga sp. Cy-1792]